MRKAERGETEDQVRGAQEQGKMAAKGTGDKYGKFWVLGSVLLRDHGEFWVVILLFPFLCISNNIKYKFDFYPAQCFKVVGYYLKIKEIDTGKGLITCPKTIEVRLC